MDAPANGSPRELGPSVVGGAGASSRFERQDATHAEAGSVPRNQAGSQAAAPGDGFCPGLAKLGQAWRGARCACPSVQLERWLDWQPVTCKSYAIIAARFLGGYLPGHSPCAREGP